MSKYGIILSMNIDNIRQLVDSVLDKSAPLSDLLQVDLPAMHYDTPILGLISGKIHFPWYKNDEEFLSCLSIYRDTELEIIKNKTLVDEFNLSKNIH